MSSSIPIVISASRRSDIPAFYMEWFFDQIRRGYFEVKNPFNKKVTQVSANPKDVHTIVFWSKNFGPFLENDYGKQLESMGFHLFFNFTINSASPVLEPNVPPLAQRLDQLKCLCQRFGADGINLRFDPICVFKMEGGKKTNNLDDFSLIVETAHKYGIKRCITSFVDLYKKIEKRVKSIKGFAFMDPDVDEKINLLLDMEKETRQLDMELSTCCEKDLLAYLPGTSKIRSSSCIPNDLFLKRFKGKLSVKKDYGQRLSQGCGCKTSVDIGSYDLHPCYHNCLFCYANPYSDGRRQHGRIDP